MTCGSGVSSETFLGILRRNKTSFPFFFFFNEAHAGSFSERHRAWPRHARALPIPVVYIAKSSHLGVDEIRRVSAGTTTRGRRMFLVARIPRSFFFFFCREAFLRGRPRLSCFSRRGACLTYFYLLPSSSVRVVPDGRVLAVNPAVGHGRESTLIGRLRRRSVRLGSCVNFEMCSVGKCVYARLKVTKNI